MNSSTDEQQAADLVELNSMDVDDEVREVKVEVDGTPVDGCFVSEPRGSLDQLEMVEVEKFETPGKEGGPVVLHTRKRHKRMPKEAMWVRLRQQVLSEVGVLEDTKANRLVAQRVMLDYCKDRGVRPYDVARAIPMAINMCFVPDEAQIEARRFEVSHAVRERKAKMAAIRPHQGLLAAVFGCGGATPSKSCP